ncbi:MAG: LytR/AlgR family response regulator transcription factor [Woeseiaceae bacterium]
MIGALFSRLGISFREWYKLIARAHPIGRYYLHMTIEGLQNYLGARLSLVLNLQQHFRMLRTVFALVFVAALVVHLLVEQGKEPLSTLIHAATVALVYVIAVGLATTFVRVISGSDRDVRVWHVWLVSLLSFALGYRFLPIDDGIVWLLGAVGDNHAGQMSMSQLLPVWFVLTYIFIQPYLNEGLKLELNRLRDINRLLKQRQSDPTPVAPTPIRFESGRTQFTLHADAIRNVVVDDHYCYVHYQQNGAFAKRDLAMPLRDVSKLLPDEFLYVHRSHIVNPKYIQSIRREKRRIRVVLDDDYEVPVSRHRLEEVLPRIRMQI